MSPSTPFFRVRWVLQTRRVVHLHPWQHAIVYALLCEANRGSEHEAALQIPDGLLLDAPEIARVRLQPGDRFAFGATLLYNDPTLASRTIHRIGRGLCRIGATSPTSSVVFGGNFDLVAVQDLVTGQSLSHDQPFQPLPADLLNREYEQLLPRLGQPLTLRFTSPLRLEMPGSQSHDLHRFANERQVNIGQFLRSVQKRLHTIGVVSHAAPTRFGDDLIDLLANELVWIDVRYGSSGRRKTLGGAVGRLRILLRDPVPLAALVWGQRAHLGRNLNFGFGAYRIEELGTDPTACQRADSLMSLALQTPHIQRLAAEYQIDSITLQEKADALQAGTYEPLPTQAIDLPKPDGGVRRLQVPAKLDRALQRLLLNQLGPAFEKLFENSSFAWRQGLSRESAARRLESLANQGWNFAVKADFDQYFETIPRENLARRLGAWCGDDALADAVMRFVPASVGVPTGAPLSPLLGNLLLDWFDEQIAAQGGQLVRYADDFLILTKSREAAEGQLKIAQSLTETLQLRLNDDSTILDLSEPFEFLGYQFQREERWQFAGPSGPRKVQELGWRDSDRVPPLTRLSLPGESSEGTLSGVVIAGPSIQSLDIVGDQLTIETPLGTHVTPMESVDQLIVIGAPNWTSDAPGKLLRHNLPTLLLSEWGWPLGELVEAPPDDAEAILAQAQACRDAGRCLHIAKGLIRAKIHNYACLLNAARPTAGPDVQRLRQWLPQVESSSDLSELRGLEGAAAALWYRLLPELLSNGFRFSRRVAPDASDPINLMLNLGFTMLHRQAVSAIRGAGLSPALGFMHSPSPRYASLAADLQEPFRHLIERAVILATRRIKPQHFVQKESAAYPLVMEPHAGKTFHVLLQRSLRQAVVGKGQADARAWVGQMLSTARSLRRHLIQPETPWQPFEHL